MILPVMLFLIGLLCLIKGGDWFVDGAVGVARRFHLPELLIGATIVSIGTTLPEVMVSTTSALTGHGEIAYGNAIGSVICNTSLIAAITITVVPGVVDRKTLKIPAIVFFVAAAIYAGTAYFSGYFSRAFGILMLLIWAGYLLLTIRQMRNDSGRSDEEESCCGEEEKTLLNYGLFLVGGATLIAIGAKLLVDNGTLIAQAMGVPESVIALTFVALGTSLPELVTAITSLLKGHGVLSLGNIIGANIFNIVLVSGVSAALAPFHIPQSATVAGYNSSLVFEIPVMIAVMLLLVIPVMVKEKLFRIQGITLLLIYAVFVSVSFI